MDNSSYYPVFIVQLYKLVMTKIMKFFFFSYLHNCRKREFPLLCITVGEIFPLNGEEISLLYFSYPEYLKMMLDDQHMCHLQHFHLGRGYSLEIAYNKEYSFITLFISMAFQFITSNLHI